MKSPTAINLLCMLGCAVHGTARQGCPSLTPLQEKHHTHFVEKWFKLPPKGSLTLIDSNSVDSACYRKLVFRASIPAPLLVLYLAPDGKHLVTNVMDLDVDPAIAQRRKQEEIQGLLSDGALLTSGPSTAPAKLVVFSDFQCPYCKRFAGFLSELTPDERARLQITYRQFPLNIHSWAQDASALGTCVALQNQAVFWTLHDFFFSQQQQLSKETLTTKALDFLSQDKSVDTQKVTSCLSSKTFQPSLDRDERLATDIGINATPTIFLNGRKIAVRSVDDLRAAIHSAETDPLSSPQPPGEITNHRPQN